MHRYCKAINDGNVHRHCGLPLTSFCNDWVCCFFWIDSQARNDGNACRYREPTNDGNVHRLCEPTNDGIRRRHCEPAKQSRIDYLYRTTLRPYGTLWMWECVLLPTVRPYGTGRVNEHTSFLPTIRPYGTLAGKNDAYSTHIQPITGK